MGIVSAISQITTKAEKIAGMYLAEIDDADGVIPGTVQQFQYYPETIQDGRSVNLEDKYGVGSSHPIYQWVRGSPRDISFETVFTSEEGGMTGNSSLANIASTISSFAKNPVAAGIGAIRSAATSKASGGDPHSVNVAAAIAWLRSKTYPMYPKNQPVKPPPKLLLWLENSGITSFVAGYEIDVIPVIMTRCDVTYESFFRNGQPRIATVNLSFVETIQVGKSWSYVDKNDFDRSWRGLYARGGKNSVDKKSAQGGSSGGQTGPFSIKSLAGAASKILKR